LEADIALIQFVKHPDTLIIDKGMSGLARRYEQFMKDMTPLDELHRSSFFIAKEKIS